MLDAIRTWLIKKLSKPNDPIQAPAPFYKEEYTTLERHLISEVENLREKLDEERSRVREIEDLIFAKAGYTHNAPQSVASSPDPIRGSNYRPWSERRKDFENRARRQQSDQSKAQIRDKIAELEKATGITPGISGIPVSGGPVKTAQETKYEEQAIPSESFRHVSDLEYLKQD